jgi:uncharacterized protein with gpF-like domain
MHHSIVYWVLSGYKNNKPEMAQDASPAMAMRKLMRKLTRRWTKNINKTAPQLADYFATAISKRSDATLQSILNKSGMTVNFKMTAEMNDVIQATVGSQVSLITKMTTQHLAEIEELVLRSVAAGRDMKYLSEQLKLRYSMTKRRAARIARDQNNFATAQLVRVRQKKIGATHAMWVHSAGGKEPRESHVKAGKDKLIYEIDKGAYLESNGGKFDWIWPGAGAIGCRCVSKTIIPD